MAAPNDQDVVLLEIPLDSKLPYLKIDKTQACRVNEDFAVSFYQTDYQALASAAMNGRVSSTEPLRNGMMLASRIVLNREAFTELFRELTRVANLTGIKLERDGNEAV